MLSEEITEKLVERLVSRIEDGNLYILKKIGKNLDEIGTLKSSNVEVLIQVLKYGGDYEKIVKKLEEITKINAMDIKKIFEEVAKKDYNFAKRFYDYRNKAFIPFEENNALKNQVEALANRTMNEYLNFSKTSLLGYGWQDELGNVVFKGLKETYFDLIDTAVLNVGQGKESFDSALFRQLKEIGSGGLKVIYPTTYKTEIIDKNGVKRVVEKHHIRRLDSAMRMNLKEALRDLHNETQKIIGSQFNADGVEVSVHEYPAPDHCLVQGKQFSNEEFNKFQNNEDSKSYDGVEFSKDFEGHDRRSISQYNCYHYIFSIVLGVSQPIYSNEELKEINKRNEDGFIFENKKYSYYEGTQLQRKIETEIRKAKDCQILARASNNEDLIRYSQERITKLTNKYNKLVKVSGLSPKADRLRVSGYHRLPSYDNTINFEKFRNLEIIKKLENKNVNVDLNLFVNEKNLMVRNLGQLDNLINKYPALQESLKDRKLMLSTSNTVRAIGSTTIDGELVRLSNNYFKNKKTIVEVEKFNTEGKWHNEVYKRNYDLYTLTHELGHVIEDRYMLKMNKGLYTQEYRRKIDTRIKNEILDIVSKETGLNKIEVKKKYFSGYAKSTSNFEWWAETFTQLELGRENPLTKAMSEWLEANFK